MMGVSKTKTSKTLSLKTRLRPRPGFLGSGSYIGVLGVFVFEAPIIRPLVDEATYNTHD